MKGVRQFGIRLTVDRDGLLHVLAGIAVGVEHGLRSRTQPLAGALIITFAPGMPVLDWINSRASSMTAGGIPTRSQATSAARWSPDDITIALA